MTELKEKVTTAEDRLRALLGEMGAILVEPGAPRFSEFWKGRKEMIILFKENLPVKVRAELWKEFAKISAEARKLKEILDEESSFAAQQIELAILSLEKDLENLPILREKMPSDISVAGSFTLKGKEGEYLALSKELSLLNTLGVKLRDLREELIKTGMRIRTKNQLFERLSRCGDLIFPRRKEVLSTLSSTFCKDVVSFCQGMDGDLALSSADVKLEIEQLEKLSKELPLNSASFAKVRKDLSFALAKSARPKMSKPQSEKRSSFVLPIPKRSEEWMVVAVDAESDVIESALKEGRDQRLAVKKDLEGYRKALGNSGFDFEKAMMYRELIEAEKKFLEKINSALEEIESRA